MTQEIEAIPSGHTALSRTFGVAIAEQREKVVAKLADLIFQSDRRYTVARRN